MVDFRGVLEARSVNATVAWLATGALVLSAAVLFVTDAWLWAAFGLIVVGVVVFPPIGTREIATTLPGELVALVALPVAVRATGLFPQITPFATMAGLALLVLLVLDAFTSLQLSPRFAVLFVVVTTMAFAGVWAIAEFAADAVLGTEYVVGKREQNLDLIVATGAGLVAGFLFAAYFRETDGDAPLEERPLPFPFALAAPAGGASATADDGATSDGSSAADDGGPDDGSATAEDASPRVGATTADDGALRRGSAAADDGPSGGSGNEGATPDGARGPADGKSRTAVGSTASSRFSASPGYRYAFRAFQVVIVAVTGYALATRQGALFVNGVLSLGVTLLPTIARWKFDYDVQAGLALLVAVAATLHVVGLLGPYETTDWYDTVTHALSSTLVAGVGYAIVRSIELDTDRVEFSSEFRGVFVVLFVLAVGVLWEILEFGSGLAASVFGRSVLIQYGVTDIIKDLAFNVVGAVVVALWGTPLFRRPARVLTGTVGERLR